MTQHWSRDDGLIDVTSSFQGVTTPTSELIDDIHRRGWTLNKVHIKDGQYVAVAKSPHKESLEATGRTEATAIANVLVKVMRREHMRSSSIREKLGAWDAYPIEQQFAQIAQAYASAPVYEPKAAPAWMDLAQDCARRAQIIRMQIEVEVTDNPVPYETADELREDVTKKRHIEVSRAYAHHPVWSEQQMLDYRLVVDVLGHAATVGDWGWHGTCLAFAALAPLLAESPQKALFTELLGQSAFGAFYRQWGPQKIVFLEELVEKAQEKENKPGHHPVHPSQSIVPITLPSIFSAVKESNLQWQPGQWGKGFTVNGKPYTWPVNNPGVQGGTPHHHEIFEQTFPDDGVTFFQDPAVISPEGWYTVDPIDDPDLMNDPTLFARHQRGLKYVRDPAKWETRAGGQLKSSSAPTVDPNADWESGVHPLQDNAYLWQRQNGIDPLDSQGVLDALHPLESGIANMHPELMRQSVVNALRGSLLGTRNNARDHAIHYQDLMHLPAGVDDPIAFWDALERQRENHNQAQGYAPGSHKQYWPEEQQFQQWVKAANPELDDGDVQRVAKRELLHMLSEEEERILAQDQGEQLPAEVIEHEAYEAIRRRLKALTKPTVDQKVDFGDHHLYHEASADLINGADLPHGLGSNVDLADQLRSMYGDSDLSNYNFQLQTLPISSIDTGGQLLTLADYEKMGEDVDGPRRAEIVRNHMARLQAGEPHIPLVVDPVADYARHLGGGDYWLRDGYHRLAAARTLGHTEHPAYVLALDDDGQPVQHLGKTATHHADMYPPYLHSRMRPLAQIGRYADALTEAARQDLMLHRGHGHHFRAQALNLGIPGVGPRQVSNAWMHLAPQTSNLGIINPEIADILGHDYSEMSNRDYFKWERELAAGRDAAGYGHVPLGAFSAGMHDLYMYGPGQHPDRTPFKAYSPTPHQSVDWLSGIPSTI